MTITYGPRRRSRSFSEPSTLVWVTNGVPGTPVTVMTHKESNTMDDVVTENFKTRSAQGEIFNNPMTRVDVVGDIWPLTLKYVLGGNVWSGNPNGPFDFSSNAVCGPPSGRDAAIANAIGYCSTKALGKCTSEVTQSLVTLGELRETKELLRTAAIRLINCKKFFNTHWQLLNDLRNSVPKKAAKIYLALENSWMEIRMGWRPFAGEVENFYNAWHAVESKVQQATFRDFDNLSFQNAQTISGWDVSNLFRWSGNSTYYETVEIRAGVLARMRYGGVADTWGVTKFPQTVWELTKLSWLSDYFCNVADIIAAYTPDSLWSAKARWVTVTSKVLQEVIQTNMTPNYGGSLSCSIPFKLSVRTTTKTRTPDPNIGFYWKPGNLEIPELLDSLAVCRQQVIPLITACAKLAAKVLR